MMKPTIALGVFAALLSPALSATIRINALGDSITGSPVPLTISRSMLQWMHTDIIGT